MLAHKIGKERDVSCVGCAFENEASPHDSPRFAGWRFQVTHLHLPFFADVDTWKYFGKPPVSVRKHLLDMVHCPATDGLTVHRAVEKQWATVGITPLDILAGAGGIKIGWAVAFPGNQSRLDAASHAGRQAAAVLGGVIVMLFLAGLLEGFGRQLITNDLVRYGIGITTLILWLCYFYIPRDFDGEDTVDYTGGVE